MTMAFQLELPPFELPTVGFETERCDRAEAAFIIVATLANARLGKSLSWTSLVCLPLSFKQKLKRSIASTWQLFVPAQYGFRPQTHVPQTWIAHLLDRGNELLRLISDLISS